jgi:hypothetical protein
MTHAKVSVEGSSLPHEHNTVVEWSKTGNLNHPAMRGFYRQTDAIAFAKRKALSFGEGTTLTIDVRSGSKAYVVSSGKLVSPDKARKPAAKKTTAKPKTKTTQTKKPAGKVSKAHETSKRFGSSFKKTMSNIMKDPW